MNTWRLACAGVFMIALVSGWGAPAQRGRASAQKRPPPASDLPLYEDVAARAGLRVPLTCGSAEKHLIMESLCGGVALFDYDNDGRLDILLVQGSTLQGAEGDSRLYRNNKDGTFTDVTQTAGPFRRGWGFGVAVGDYDNDGWEDLYITYLDGGRLYRNDRGHFVDVTDKAGVNDGGAWGTSAAFGDFDHDGRLDLYVANYVDLNLHELPAFGAGPNCQYRGIPVSCGPRGLKGARDHLYRNNGDGSFTDVTAKLNIDRDASYGLGVLWADLNGDGCLDLYVSNDSSPSELYLGDCKGGLKPVGLEAGVAYSDDGHMQAGMGVDAADYDNDGRVDLVKTNFSDDANNLYHNDGGGQFTDVAGPAGFGPISTPYLGFGARFLDFDNDGWKDIFIVNGHVNPQVDRFPLGITYAERNLLFHNKGNGTFSEVGMNAGPALQVKNVGRGLATGDLWNDGKTELLVTRLGQPPAVLRDRATHPGHWIELRLIGTKSNRDGLGARVSVTAAGRTQIDEVRANSSYLSASDRTLHFGVGAVTSIQRIAVRWPSGAVQRLESQPVDRILVLTEGKSAVTVAPANRATLHH